MMTTHLVPNLETMIRISSPESARYAIGRGLLYQGLAGGFIVFLQVRDMVPQSVVEIRYRLAHGVCQPC